jgi:DNA-binding transcriptional MerR regulator
MSDILLVEEVSEMTRLPKATLRFYRHRGYGGPKSFKIGNRVCYMRADVEQYIRDAYNAEVGRSA